MSNTCRGDTTTLVSSALASFPPLFFCFLSLAVACLASSPHVCLSLSSSLLISPFVPSLLISFLSPLPLMLSPSSSSPFLSSCFLSSSIISLLLSPFHPFSACFCLSSIVSIRFPPPLLLFSLLSSSLQLFQIGLWDGQTFLNGSGSVLDLIDKVSGQRVPVSPCLLLGAVLLSAGLTSELKASPLYRLQGAFKSLMKQTEGQTVPEQDNCGRSSLY